MADKLEEVKLVEIEVDPEKTTLEDILELAEAQSAGVVSIRGESEDGTTQWGIVATCGDNSSDVMNQLQVTVDASIAKWLTSKMN